MLFLLVVAGSLRASWLGARRFEALGRRDLEAFAYSILVAQVAILLAGLSLSSQIDKRLWILLALGPATFEASKRLSLRRLAP